MMERKTSRQFCGARCDIVHPLGLFRACCIHLDAHSAAVIELGKCILLDHLDLFTNFATIRRRLEHYTHNSQNARAHLGLLRRVMMALKISRPISLSHRKIF
jgi:hypothetical protein